ncbi:MAG: HlyD family efflux transporter periplasmic adaptor subunit [Chloroflexota bacterium]
MKRRKWLWRIIILLLVLGLLGGGAAWFGLLPTQQPPMSESDLAPLSLVETVPIQRADAFIEDLVLGGRLALRTVREVKAPFDETVAQVNVEVGAAVMAGDVLVALDRQELSSQLDTAWFNLTKTRLALAELVGPPSEIDLLDARAAHLTAQEALDKLVDGPTAADVNGALLAIQEAQTASDELLARNDPNSTRVREARYSLRQAQIAVEQAQTAYDAVSWRGDLAALSESAALQSATISFENAQNSFDELTKPPSALELQQAQLAIDKANNAYNQLFTAATPGEIAQAEASVSKAAERIDELTRGPSAQAIQDAEIAVLDALTQFENTRIKLLQGSDLGAPIDGVVTKLSATVGQVVKEGETVAVVAAPDQFKLTITVDENSILLVEEDMPVTIASDLVADALMSGTVTYIAPVDSNSLSQSANDTAAPSNNTQPAQYPVTIAVDDATVPAALRAGMTVQVTFVGSSQLKPNSWLVPVNAMTPAGEGFATIEIVRSESPEPLQVEVTGQTQGEWVVVVSDVLQEGDLVVGSLSSFLGEEQFNPFGP